MYDHYPTRTPTENADRNGNDMTGMAKKVGNAKGNVCELAYQVAPRGVDVILNAGYKIFPDSHAAKGAGDRVSKSAQPTPESVAFAHILCGVHW